MMSGSSSGRVLRRLAPLLPFLLGALSGCGDLTDPSYPSALTYPARSDPLVVEAPKIEPWNPDSPGQLDQSIARIGLPKDKGGLGSKAEGGGEALDPKQLPAETRREVEKELLSHFNTPRFPRVEEFGDNAELAEYAEKLQLDRKTLYKGSQLFRRHCMHCHGVPGDGRGPTGPWLNPHPRDYRQGVFKFISTDVKVKGRKPRREDLLRTLRKGIDGTSMPSFGLQTDEELEQIVSYVIHLSIRGEVEFGTLRGLLENMDKTTKKVELKDLDVESVGEYVQVWLKKVLTAWGQSDKSNIPPAYNYGDAELAASIKRGYELFADAKKGVGCIKCHADFGRQVPYKYDEWGTLVRPANLTTGLYRGGRRPIDLYWRIRGGIPPSQMPEVPPDTVKPLAPNTEPYWDLVNFIQALPYPRMLPKDVRDRIYPESSEGHEPAHARAD